MNQKQHQNYNLEVQVKHGRKQSMTRVFSGFKSSLKSKAHALLLRGALIAVAAVGAMSGLGVQISKTFNNSSTTMSKG